MIEPVLFIARDLESENKYRFYINISFGLPADLYTLRKTNPFMKLEFAIASRFSINIKDDLKHTIFLHNFKNKIIYGIDLGKIISTIYEGLTYYNAFYREIDTRHFNDVETLYNSIIDIVTDPNELEENLSSIKKE